jgi:hypothetical protein
VQSNRPEVKVIVLAASGETGRLAWDLGARLVLDSETGMRDLAAAVESLLRADWREERGDANQEPSRR